MNGVTKRENEGFENGVNRPEETYSIGHKQEGQKKRLKKI